MNLTELTDLMNSWNLSIFEKDETINNFLNSNTKTINNLMNSTLNNWTINNEHFAIVDIPRDSIPLIATVTVFYIIIFIAGIVGNLITCAVISRNKLMHTATNYYLLNLAISDLILLISGMPPDLYNIWYPMSYPFNNTICILQGILSETSTNATVLTITAFTVERYIAICHPFRQHTMSKLSRAVKFILAIWLLGFILATPQAMQFGIMSIGKGKLCTMKDSFMEYAFEISGFVFFVGPMTAISVLYILIGIKLKQSKYLKGAQRNGSELNRGIRGQTRVIRMLIAVVVTFFLCWAPFHAQRLMAVYGSAFKNTSETFYKIYSILTYISGILYFLSTCINPLLYSVMSFKFRNALKHTIAEHLICWRKKEDFKSNDYSALAHQNGSMKLTANTKNRNKFKIMSTDIRRTSATYVTTVVFNSSIRKQSTSSQSRTNSITLK